MAGDPSRARGRGGARREPLGEDDQRRRTSRPVDIVDVDHVAAPLPLVKPNARFLLACHPDRWSAGLDGLVLPEFSFVRIEPGVNGVRLDEHGRVQWATAVAGWRRRGYTVIDTRHGPDGESYCHATDCDGGVHYHTPWEILYGGTDMRECDRKGMAEWVWELVDKKVIPGPSVVGLQRELRAMQQKKRAADTKAKMSTEHEHIAESYGRACAALTELIEKSPKPARARSRGAAEHVEE